MSLAKVATVNAGRTDSDPDLTARMIEMGRRARTAARVLALAPAAQKDKALAAMVQALRDHTPEQRAKDLEHHYREAAAAAASSGLAAAGVA